MTIGIHPIGVIDLQGGEALRLNFFYIKIAILVVVILGCNKTSLNSGGNIADVEDGEISEPVPVAGAFLACIATEPSSAQMGVDLYCGLKNASDRQLIVLPATATLPQGTLHGTKGIKHQLPAQKSLDPDWHWLFLDVLVNFSDYLLFTVEVASSNIANGQLQSYLLEPAGINKKSPTEGIADLDLFTGAPLAFEPWTDGEPNDYQGMMENCVSLLDVNIAYVISARKLVWNDYICDKPLRFACQSKTEPLNWQISERDGSWDQSAEKCPPTHQFAIPGNSAENDALIKVVNATLLVRVEHTVWMNARKAVPYVNYFIKP